jgi:hypothetical protein
MSHKNIFNIISEKKKIYWLNKLIPFFFYQFYLVYILFLIFFKFFKKNKIISLKSQLILI